MRGIFSVYKNPTDARWQGRQRWGPRMMFPITLLFILNWIFFISDQAYSRTLWDKYIAKKRANVAAGRPLYTDISRVPPVEWYPESNYYSSDGVGQFFVRSATAVLPETIHIPLHLYLYQKNHMHPIAALTLSLVFMSLWMTSAWMNFIFSSDGDSFVGDYGSWFSLIYTEFAFQLMIFILYFVYMGFAAHAVKLYNRGKKDTKAYERGVAKGIELAKMDKDVKRKDAEAYERGVMKGLDLAQGDAEVEHIEYREGVGKDLPELVERRGDDGKNLPPYEV